jgi:hypothetical protein
MAGVLNELKRRGYVAAAHSGRPDRGVICNHPTGPSLLVCDDGRLELLSGEEVTETFIQSQVPANRIRWRRALPFLALLPLAAFLGLLIVGMIAG